MDPAPEASPLTIRPAVLPRHDMTSEAIGEMFASARRRQIALARTITGDRDLAEQAVDEAYIQVLSSLGRRRHEPITNLRAYVDRTIVNVSVRQSRRRKGLQLRTLLSGRSDVHFAPDPADVVATHDLVETLLSRLTGPQRAVIVLRFGLDLKEREIATLLDLPIGTVKSRIARALARLKLEHTEGGDDDA